MGREGKEWGGNRKSIKEKILSRKAHALSAHIDGGEPGIVCTRSNISHEGHSRISAGYGA
jgi:hypothetical protein